jgi:D-lactate dehydrogenase
MRKLFAPNARAVGRPPGPTKYDAVPDSLIDGTPPELRDDLVRLHRFIDLIRYAADASPYRLLPKAVVMPRNASRLDEVH